jgi:hypothetical protein
MFESSSGGQQPVCRKAGGGGLIGLWGCGLVVQQALGVLHLGGPVGCWPSRPTDSSGVAVAACLFFQCIVAWRRLPQARGPGYQSFSSPLCFTSAKHVSSISARSLIHRAHTVYICVPFTIFGSSPEYRIFTPVENSIKKRLR